MSKREDIPWSKREIWTILFVFVVSMVLATYMLLVKSWVYVAAYWAIWMLFFFLGRFMICRHCDYLTRPCPTLCMGILAGKLFARSNKKDFTEIRTWTFYLDVAFIVAAMIFPLIVYGYFIFREGLTRTEWFLIAVYVVVGITAQVIHSRSCKKCAAGGCPLR